ncbi:MAG TPA: PorP/SprF family type IX secretion system membrane protein [Chitinophagaceae bacterium]|nr:PorP/SprF family type IX secretion system membrane protein [Chitinophagaceae bacterium]
MKNILLIWAFSILGAATAAAQDANFSQVNQLPLMLNPANTGAFEKDWRAGGIFRNTTYTAAQAYRTGVFSIEKRMRAGFISEGDVLGLGVFGLSDQSNGGALSSNFLGLSTAFGKALNSDGSSRLSVGLQGVWATKRLDVNKLTFEDQFTSGGFEGSTPSADAYRGGSSNYLDLNAGISYSFTQATHGLNLGAALYHAGKPREQFMNDTYELPVRYSLNANGYFTVAGKDQIHLNATTNHQGKADEYLMGAYFSKNVVLESENIRLNMGSYYRLQSAIIPYFGIQTSKWTGGISYDVSSGKINKANANRKSLELSMTALF